MNSEYLNGRTSDNWRNFQLLKHGASSDHPFSKFGCGNYETLTDGGDAELPVAGSGAAGVDGGGEEAGGGGRRRRRRRRPSGAGRAPATP